MLLQGRTTAGSPTHADFACAEVRARNLLFAFNRTYGFFAAPSESFG